MKKEHTCMTQVSKKTYVTPVAEVLAIKPHTPLLGMSRITFDTKDPSSFGDQTEPENYLELPDGQTPLSKDNHWGDLWEEY